MGSGSEKQPKRWVSSTAYPLHDPSICWFSSSSPSYQQSKLTQKNFCRHSNQFLNPGWVITPDSKLKTFFTESNQKRNKIKNQATGHVRKNKDKQGKWNSESKKPLLWASVPWIQLENALAEQSNILVLSFFLVHFLIFFCGMQVSLFYLSIDLDNNYMLVKPLIGSDKPGTWLEAHPALNGFKFQTEPFYGEINS